MTTHRIFAYLQAHVKNINETLTLQCFHKDTIAPEIRSVLICFPIVGVSAFLFLFFTLLALW